MGFTSVKPSETSDNAIKIIRDDWTLLCAGDMKKMNFMTASWAGIGELWYKDVFFAFVRHSRLTFEFFEKNDYFSCSFFNSQYKPALNLCGTKSGRDIDKVRETGLTPVSGSETVYFEEARLVYTCKKLYSADVIPDNFTDRALYEKCYKSGDLHRMYVGEITDCLIKK